MAGGGKGGKGKDELEADQLDPDLYERLVGLARANGVDLAALKRGEPKVARSKLAHLPDFMREQVLAAHPGCDDPEPDPEDDPELRDAADRGDQDDDEDGTAESDTDAVNAGTKRRPPGRPRKSQALVDWDAIENLLLYGEPYEFQGRTLVRFPTNRELGKRFNVDHSAIAKRMKDRKLDERRASLKVELDRKVDDIITTEHAAAIAHGREQVIDLCDILMGQFAKLAREGKIRVDSIADFNTLARLREFAAGGPDGRTEVGVVTLADLQERHRAAKQVRVIDVQPMLGVVDERIVERAGGTFEILPAAGAASDPAGIASGSELKRERKANGTPAPAASLRIDDPEDEEDEPPPADDLALGHIATHDVLSDNLAELGYDDERGVMEVVFRTGQIWRYRVPRQTYTEIDNASSVGKAFDRLVKKQGVLGKRVDV